VSDEVLVRPEGEVRGAALVLGGSSGRVEDDRCRVLAAAGIAALSLRWFGGHGQPPGICEVPLETFAPALRRLRDLAPSVGVLGLSKGAEAALLLAVDDPHLSVVAVSPTHVVWANVGAGLDGRSEPQRSSWTRGGEPLAWVPYDGTWAGTETVGLYEQSLRSCAAEIPAATIPVERIAAAVVVVAGGDDRVWPSVRSAEAIRARRGDRPTTIVTHPDAGHRVVFPGESPVTAGAALVRGGTPQADAALGAMAWPHVLRALGGLDSSPAQGF
jgi:dienelactone hydrolase